MSCSGPATALRQAARCPSRLASERRAFSSTPSQNEMSRLRTTMYEWLNKLEGQMARKEGTQYIGGNDQPFPNNPFFRSQAVLDENARETIWRRVQRKQEPMKVVSADMGVDVRRVAAVVRLKEIEKSWMAKKKKLAKPYSKAIMAMLPRTSYDDGVSKPVHEPINDVHVHGHTMQQVFLPVSESRHFTREDAAKAFNRKMLSADDRSQHPELVSMMRGVLGGERRGDSTKKFVEAARESEQALVRKAEAAQQREAARTTNVQSDRFEFRIQAFNSERVGILGRDRHATGWRYGAPLDDRKRGKVRIPTSVP